MKISHSSLPELDLSELDLEIRKQSLIEQNTMEEVEDNCNFDYFYEVRISEIGLLSDI